ncbi:MAG: hypothetical protein ACE5HU_03570 [Acidobacteriota bacterium]
MHSPRSSQQGTRLMGAGIACAILVVVAAVQLAAGADLPAAAPLSVDDIITLLKANIGEGVILEELAATRTRIIPTVEALLELKAAGASDSLLEAILESGQDPTEGDTDEPREVVSSPQGADPSAHADGNDVAPPFRIYTTVDENGDVIVHITNLDRSGRRIGGEIPETAARNVIEPRPDSPASPRAAEELRGAGSDYRTTEANEESPVVVNVYPPERSEPEHFGQGPSAFGSVGGGIYPGLYPGGFGFVPGSHADGFVLAPYPSNHPHGLHAGYGYTLSPPGSYSHYILYHRPYGARHFSRYHVRGYGPYGYPAASRNRAFFGHR